MTSRYIPLLFAAVLSLALSCEDDAPLDEVPLYDVPTSYRAFDNVDYSGQISRLAQLSELKAYAKTAHDGAPLDSARMAAMYTNSRGAGFSQAYEKDLYAKTFAPVRDAYFDYIGRMAELSTLGAASRDRSAGLHRASNGKAYLLANNGVEYVQVIEKGLMGDCFYYQANAVYLSDERMSADNQIVEPGRGTERQHFFDEAFGYFGAPKDFPADVDGIAFWADYSNDRDADLETNDIMASFLRGRAALVNEDDVRVEAAVTEISDRWQLIAGGTAIHYLNQALAHGADLALRSHDLTEAIAFARAISRSQRAELSAADLDDWTSELTGASSWEKMNLWDVSDQSILAARASLAQALDIEDSADEL